MTFASEQQSADALEVLKGERVAVIIEERKAPETYKFYRKLLILPYGQTVEAGVSGAWITRHNSAEGPEIVIASSSLWFREYLDLLDRRHDYDRTAFQTAFGYLLGYDSDSVAEFVASPPDCECSKCGGPYAESYLQTDHGRYYDPNPRALKGAAGIQDWSTPTHYDPDVQAELDRGSPYMQIVAPVKEAEVPSEDENIGVYLDRHHWLLVRFGLIDALYKEGQSAETIAELESLIVQIRTQAQA